MIKTYIVGIGMTRFGKHRHESVKSLTAAAVEQALADCSIPQERVGAAFFANTVQGELEGQLMIRGQIALRPLGFEGIPIINVENACASGATAVNLAINYIRSGSADVALAVGVDKMVSPDKELMFGIFDGAWTYTILKLGGHVCYRLAAPLSHRWGCPNKKIGHFSWTCMQRSLERT